MAADSDPDKGKPVDTSATDDLFAGTHYRLVGRIGRGGMGEVFHVVHDKLGRDLAAKVLYKRFAGDEQLLERVRVEAQVLGGIKHDNVVEVTDYFQQTRDGRPFFVMEYLTGRTLHDELSGGRVMSLIDAVDFVHQALRGLVAVHALGVVHREIKTENLFLAEEPNGMITVKLLDFGLARVIAGVSSDAPFPIAVATQTDEVLGTPRYSSPEGALGKKVDQRADLYSMALVFYETVAGRGPFEHLQHDFLTAHVREDPAPPSRYANRSIPPEFDAVVLRGLQKNPADRYQSAEEFQLALERLWALINDPAAPEIVVLANDDPSHFRTTGQLRQLELPPPAREEAQPELPRFASSRQVHLVSAKPDRMTPAQIAVFILIATVTAITMTGLVFLVLRKIAP